MTDEGTNWSLVFQFRIPISEEIWKVNYDSVINSVSHVIISFIRAALDTFRIF